MREIKFRAWCKITEEMIYDGLVLYNGKPIAMKVYSGADLFKIPDKIIDPGWILMQFTGLKDKNGKEIYEGDIVKLEMTLKPEMITEYGQGEIIFHDAHYFCRVKGDGDITLNWCDSVEVIGNIYENKELLKEDLEDGKEKKEARS